MKSSTAAASLLLPRLGFLGIVVGKGLWSSILDFFVFSVADFVDLGVFLGGLLSSEIELELLETERTIRRWWMELKIGIEAG